MAGGAVLALNGLAPRPKRAEAPSCARTAWPDPLGFRHNQGDARATSSGTLHAFASSDGIDSECRAPCASAAPAL